MTAPSSPFATSAFSLLVIETILQAVLSFAYFCSRSPGPSTKIDFLDSFLMILCKGASRGLEVWPEITISDILTTHWLL